MINHANLVTPTRGMTRRALLRGAALGAAGIPLLLGACVPNLPGAPRPPNSTGAGTAKLQMPTYVPTQGIAPDFAGNADGLEPGYTSFPKTLFKSVKQAPGRGGDVSSILFAGGPANPVENNVAWQQLNAALGTNLKINQILQADYAARWGAITAGGDLPDLMFISIVPTLPNVPAFLKQSCADLTPYLSGDAVKNLPNLANIPATPWKVVVQNGAISGVPLPRTRSGWPMFVNQTRFDEIGATAPRTADDFTQLCKALTSARDNRWAMGVTDDNTSGPYNMLFFQGMFRAPNNWRVDPGGKWIKDIETEEYRAALTYNRSLVEAGYVSPDVKPNLALNNDLMGGTRIAMRGNSWNGYTLWVNTVPTIKWRILRPFGHDGGKGANMLGPGNFGYTAIKKGSPERVQELLRIIDFFAAPFGSEEYVMVRYGAREVDFKLDGNGVPVQTDQGKVDLTVSWMYIGAPPPVLFSAVQPDFARWAHDEEEALLAAGVADPSIGLYSETDQARGAVLNQLIFDRVLGIAAGRAPLSDLDQLVKDWRAQGGDKVRDEFQKAAEAAI
jgi:putative aldouronate transport system substrate-binding protein